VAVDDLTAVVVRRHGGGPMLRAERRAAADGQVLHCSAQRHYHSRKIFGGRIHHHIIYRVAVALDGAGVFVAVLAIGPVAYRCPVRRAGGGSSHGDVVHQGEVGAPIAGVHIVRPGFETRLGVNLVSSILYDVIKT